MLRHFDLFFLSFVEEEPSKFKAYPRNRDSGRLESRFLVWQQFVANKGIRAQNSTSEFELMILL